MHTQLNIEAELVRRRQTINQTRAKAIESHTEQWIPFLISLSFSNLKHANLYQIWQTVF